MPARTTLATACAVALCALMPAAAAHAQAAAVAGSWIAEVPTRVENVNGEVHVAETARVRYTFEVKGDSVFGTSLRLGLDSAVPRKLSGTISNGVITLASEPTEARVRMNMDAEQRMMMVTQYVLHVEGEALVGTQESHSTDGTIGGEERPFKAVREKA